MRTRCASRSALTRTDLLNDLEALAWCVPVLEPSEIEVLWGAARSRTAAPR